PTALHPAFYGLHSTCLSPIATGRHHKTEVRQTTKLTKPSTSLVLNQSFLLQVHQLGATSDSPCHQARRRRAPSEYLLIMGAWTFTYFTAQQSGRWTLARAK
ncbi:unnamed protein product, partial [Ectocarpus sp. 13 AM-2016]